MPVSASFLIKLLIWAVPTIFAIVLHEVMHGFVARAFGDDTAARSGRLTLNPINHIDPLGTLIIPAMLLFLRLPVFGYAKPVPVDFRQLQPRRIGMIMVAAAGPTTNFVLAAISAFILRLMEVSPDGGSVLARIIASMLFASLLINVMLGVFNLLPLLPLDGGRVLAGLLPAWLARPYAQLERYGFLLVLLLLYTDWLGRIMDPLINAITRALL